jgi:hypothetical protein
MVDRKNIPAQGATWQMSCLVILLTYVGLPVVFFGSVKVVWNMLQRPVIESLYGTQAYTNGIRVVGRQGQLSDGRSLPPGWNLGMAIGAYVLSMPVWLGYCAILAAFELFPPESVSKKK